jgi:molybdopterin-guanine dinucleotide biosynthesis protein A
MLYEKRPAGLPAGRFALSGRSNCSNLAVRRKTLDGSSSGQKSFEQIHGITAVILAGGVSSRMGSNKALLTVEGAPLIEKIYLTLAQLFREVVLVTNTPEEYAFLPCPMVADRYPGVGPLAGLHAGLMASSSDRIFLTACDTPFLNPDVIRMICSDDGGYDAVVPVSRGGKEPLQALYGLRCLTMVEQALERGDWKLLNLLDRVQTRFVTREELTAIPDAELSFCNVNTPEEYGRLSAVTPGQLLSCACGDRQRRN